MTISSETTRVSYAGDGATVSFSITFTILAKADLVVILRDANNDETVETLDSAYTINDDMDTLTWIKGGAPVVPPASGETLLLIRGTGYTQGDDYITGGGFLAETVETELDRLTMLTQQLKEMLDRALLLPRTNSQSGKLFYMGTGTPEGNITAPIGSMYFNLSGGSATTLYVKESGAGNTGWVGK
jgi:hypothetical protein